MPEIPSTQEPEAGMPRVQGQPGYIARPQKDYDGRAVVAHIFNPTTQEAETSRSEFKTSLIYKESSRLAKTFTQRNPVFKTTTAITTTAKKGEREKEKHY